MTERKKLTEQRAAHQYQVGTSVYRPRRDERESDGRHDALRTSYSSKHRDVKVPRAADLSGAGNRFAERQEYHRRLRERRSHKKVEVVSRTFAQTGSWATSGQIKAVRRSLPRSASPVPLRSSLNRNQRGWLWKFLGMVGVVVLALIVVNVLFNGDILRIKQVNIVGTHDAVLTRQIQKMGIQGQDIFLLNAEGISARIAALPMVENVVVSKSIPDQLTVTIVERQPVLFWKNDTGTFSVDSHGMVLSPVVATPGANQLPTVIDVTQQNESRAQNKPSIHPGMYLKQEDIPFVLAALQKIPKVTGIDGFTLYYDGTMYASTTEQSGGLGSSRGSFILESPNGWKAYLGGSHDPNSLDNRLIELRELLALAQKQQLHLSTIDLRYGLRPVFTLQ